jgi:hypothetical protein
MDEGIEHRRVGLWDVTINHDLGLLTVEHSGRIGWEHLQKIKNEVWGPEARAIEVYPAQGDVVNNGNFRHLWRLGAGDFCPDLLGFTPKRTPGPDMLQERCAAVWREAAQVFA